MIYGLPCLLAKAHTYISNNLNFNRLKLLFINKSKAAWRLCHKKIYNIHYLIWMQIQYIKYISAIDDR